MEPNKRENFQIPVTGPAFTLIPVPIKKVENIYPGYYMLISLRNMDENLKILENPI